jgi:hypothetical protein
LFRSGYCALLASATLLLNCRYTGFSFPILVENVEFACFSNLRLFHESRFRLDTLVAPASPAEELHRIRGHTVASLPSDQQVVLQPRHNLLASSHCTQGKNSLYPTATAPLRLLPWWQFTSTPPLSELISSLMQSNASFRWRSRSSNAISCTMISFSVSHAALRFMMWNGIHAGPSMTQSTKAVLFSP